MKKTKITTGKIIPLTATSFVYKRNQRKIDKKVKKILKSGFYILGEENKELEEKLSEYLKIKHVITVASGTDALTLSIKALNLGNMDEAMIPANVYPTAFGVALSGVKLKIVDVDPLTLNISLDTIKKRITPKIKAIVAVHLYGNPVDILPIRNFAKDRGVYLIEDCSQAIGASLGNKKVGSFGDISTFSFYPTKNLAAFGDGGAIATNNSKLASRVRLLRMYGEKARYKSILLGHNSRFDELQAGILNVQLDDLDRMNQKRRKLAKIYERGLKDLPVRLIKTNRNCLGVYHLFCIMTNRRVSLAKYLKKKGVETGIHYPIAVHFMKSLKHLNYKPGDFVVSEEASKKILSLPIHQFLEDQEISYICQEVKNFFKQT